MKNETTVPPFQQDTTLRKRLLWPIAFRLLISFFGLLYLTAYHNQPLWSVDTLPLLFAYGINILYLIWIRARRYYFWLAVLQISIDLVLISLAVYIQGVFYSIYPFLYFAIVFYTPIITRPTGGVLTASFSTILISLISLAYFLSSQLQFPLPAVPKRLIVNYAQSQSGMIPYIISFGLSLHVVGFLSGKLVKRVGIILYLNQEMLEHTMDGIVALDETGKVYPLNEKATSLLPIDDVEPDPHIPISFLYPPSTWKDIYREMKEGSGGKWQIQYDNHDQPTQYLEVILSQEAVNTPGFFSGNHFYFLYLRDVTSRIRFEKTRTKAKQLKAISNLGASIAHEIRNPLSSIRSAIQEMYHHSEQEHSEEDQKLLSLVLEEADRMNRIIEEFLNYAKDRTINPVQIQLPKLIDDVQKMIFSGTTPADVDIEVDLQKQTVYGDVDQLKQIFYNLLNNAITYSNDGDTILIRSSEERHMTYSEKENNQEDAPSQTQSPEKTLSQSAPSQTTTTPDPFRQSAGTTIEIFDQGPGIDEEDLSSIFEPFYTTRDHGSGLGLAVCDQIIQSHGGWIRAENRSNQTGAVISFWLPDQ